MLLLHCFREKNLPRKDKYLRRRKGAVMKYQRESKA
jgi:hypothetical protein